MGLRSHLLNGLLAAYLKDKGIKMGLSLATRDEYKTYAGISSNTSDALIDSLLVKVSELVKQVCRRTFIDYVDDVKVEYSEGGSNNIALEELPVIQILGFEYSTDYGQTYTVLEEYVNYVLSKKTGDIRPILMTTPADTLGYAVAPVSNYTDNIFPVAINGYRISYTAGYETIPADLKLAVLDLVAYYIKNDSSVHSHKTMSPNTMQIEYISSTHLPAHIKRILDLYTSSYN